MLPCVISILFVFFEIIFSEIKLIKYLKMEYLLSESKREHIAANPTTISSFFPVLPSTYTFISFSNSCSIKYRISPKTSSKPLLFFLLSIRKTHFPRESSISVSQQQINTDWFRFVSKCLLRLWNEETNRCSHC